MGINYFAGAASVCCQQDITLQQLGRMHRGVDTYSSLCYPKS
jgi:hypothetical protein